MRVGIIGCGAVAFYCHLLRCAGLEESKSSPVRIRTRARASV